MRIEVTADDIKSGEPVNSYCCPVARAYERQTGHRCCVSTLALLDTVNGKGFDLPHTAKFFLIDFDEGRNVEPFEFRLWPHTSSSEPEGDKA